MDIMVCDRATLFNLLIGLNGYTICSGVINGELNGKNIVSVPLDVDDYMEIGYITHKKSCRGNLRNIIYRLYGNLQKKNKIRTYVTWKVYIRLFVEER